MSQGQHLPPHFRKLADLSAGWVGVATHAMADDAVNSKWLVWSVAPGLGIDPEALTRPGDAPVQEPFLVLSRQPLTIGLPCEHCWPVASAPASEERVVEVVLALARALAALHDKGRVHGSMRPEHVFDTGDGVIWIGRGVPETAWRPRLEFGASDGEGGDLGGLGSVLGAMLERSGIDAADLTSLVQALCSDDPPIARRVAETLANRAGGDDSGDPGGEGFDDGLGDLLDDFFG